VVLGWHTFTLGMHIKFLAMVKCPCGDTFSVFADPMTHFCHKAMFSPVVGWKKLTKAMKESETLSITDHFPVLASVNT
jgi:hypothetical protein